jgi:hypothetical protein
VLPRAAAVHLQEFRHPATAAAAPGHHTLRPDHEVRHVHLNRNNPFGTPFTQKLPEVERYRLIDFEEAKEGLARDAKKNRRLAGPARSTGKHLQIRFAVEDEGVFPTPWTGTVT